MWRERLGREGGGDGESRNEKIVKDKNEILLKKLINIMVKKVINNFERVGFYKGVAQANGLIIFKFRRVFLKTLSILKMILIEK